MDSAAARLTEACRALGVPLSPPAPAALARYALLLLEWNARVNLVSRQDTARILDYHLVDSLAANALLPAGVRAADVGSGAGLPGIPLALVRPDVGMLLVESSGRKATFLDHAVRELGLANVEVCHGRSEDLPALECGIILSRLTGPMKRVVRWTRHHLARGGTIVFYKTPGEQAGVDESLPTLRRCGLAVTGTRDVTLPLTGITRRFVLVGAAAAT